MEELEQALAELGSVNAGAGAGADGSASLPAPVVLQAVEDALQARLGDRELEVRARLDALAEQIEWLHKEGKAAGAGDDVDDRLRALEARSALRSAPAISPEVRLRRTGHHNRLLAHFSGTLLRVYLLTLFFQSFLWSQLHTRTPQLALSPIQIQ